MLRVIVAVLTVAAASARQLQRPTAPTLVRPTFTTSLEPAAATLVRLRGGDAADHSLSAQLLSELVGTFVLLVAVRLSSRFPASMTRPVHFPVLCTLGCLIFMLGPISNCNINPAVNLANLVMGEMSITKFGLFTLVQFIAAASSTKLVEAIVPAPILLSTSVGIGSANTSAD